MKYKLKVGYTVLTIRGETKKILVTDNGNFGLILSDKYYDYFVRANHTITKDAINHWKRRRNGTECVGNIDKYFGQRFQWITPNECKAIYKCYPNTELYRKIYPDGRLVEGKWLVDAI